MMKALLAVSLVLNAVLGWLYFKAPPAPPPPGIRQAPRQTMADMMERRRKTEEELKNYLLTEVKVPQDKVDGYFKIRETYEARMKELFAKREPDAGGKVKALMAARDQEIVETLGQRGADAVNWWMSGQKDRMSLDEWLKVRSSIATSPGPKRPFPGPGGGMPGPRPSGALPRGNFPKHPPSPRPR